MSVPEPFENAHVGRVAARRRRGAPRARSMPVFVIAVLLWHTPASAQQVPTAQAVHFLEQATFGPTTADVAAVQSLGPVPWLEQQMQAPESPMPDGLDSNQVRAQLFLHMTSGPDQVRQRMIFALSQTVVISANKNNSGEELVPWVRLLSRNAFGNYRTLLREVTLSPTMGKYLDLAYSRKASATTAPNENYPRELLQLFSIGLWMLDADGAVRRDGQGQPIPTYTQADIQQMARALTGWTFPTAPGATPQTSNPPYFVGEMEPRATSHDTASKTLPRGQVLPAGQSAQADLDAVIDNVFGHPNVGPFVATRLVRSLVTSNPSRDYVRRVAAVFDDNGAGVRGDLRAVLIAVLTDPEALTPSAADHGRLKDPVLHAIGLGRALGAQVSDPNAFMYVFGNLSQRVLTPATVFSFYSPLAPLPGDATLAGPEFQIYPPALAVQRANFVYGILNNQFGSALRVDLTPFTSRSADPAALVEQVNLRLLFGRMSPELRQQLVNATTAVPASDGTGRAVGALYLAAISSEYAVYTGANATGGVVPTDVQPPTGLTVASIAGNRVAVRWNAPAAGPVPTGYLLEGGGRPGEAIAEVPTGSTALTFTVATPPGSFYIRLRALAGAQRSAASNEVRIYVETAQKPSAPAGLLGLANGSTLGLTWRNTYTGGAPASLLLDVTGALTASLPLAMAETFSFDHVPPGSYTFRVRAVNAHGASAASNAVTLTFPLACSGAPRTPVNFQAYAVGRALTLEWDPPSSGPAPTSYILTVGGTYTLTLPVAGRGLASPVPPGTFTLSLAATNPCGTSPVTAFQTVTVR